jgi:NADPH:quinone reductase-like Zn-dependent oxidoreductase
MKIKRIFKWGFLLIVLGLGAWLFIAYWMSTNDCAKYSRVPSNPIKAIAYCEYGPPEVLQLREIEKPTPAENELLVKVYAASVNPVDSTYSGGVRLVTGLRKPKETRFGTDYAGTVEAVGEKVTQFKPGDEVLGGRTGALAEYICVREDRSVVSKPANISFAQAAAVPVAAITALQGLRDKGKIQSGQKVLVNGASGGVGTFAVQIAKAFGADVTAVCSGKNAEMVRSIGADRVIDYTKEDFTAGPERYDMIFDIVGNHSFSERRRVLKPNGICVMAGLGGSGWHDGFWSRIGGELTSYIASRFVKEKFIAYIAEFNKADMTILRDLIEAGKIKPVIDRTFPFTQVPDAVRYLETGHAKGKVVVTVSEG